MENCSDESPQSSWDLYPHYSLFQSSLFYDTDNIRIALTCKYDSLTTESGIRTFENLKSSAELDDPRTESEPKCSENLAGNAEPPDKEDIAGHRRRWYSPFGPKSREDLTLSTEPPDKKGIKSCGTVSGPKDMAHNVEPSDKEDLGGHRRRWYSPFGPKSREDLTLSTEPPDKKGIKSCGTVSAPKDLAHNLEPLDIEHIEREYTLFWPLCSEEPVRNIEPLEEEDKERCRTVTSPMWPVDLACSAKPPDKEDIEGGYTLFKPKWSDNQNRRLERPNKTDILICRTVYWPKWSDLVSNAEPPDKDNLEGEYTLFGPLGSEEPVRRIEMLDKEDIDGEYTLFGPLCSEVPLHRMEPLKKENKERRHTVSGPMWPVDLACSAEPLNKADIEEAYTLFGPKWSDYLERRLEPLNKKEKARRHTVSEPKWSDLVNNTEPLDQEDIEREYTLFGSTCSEDLACSGREPLDREVKNNEEDVGPESEKQTITKKELYRDPDLFQSRSEYVEPIAPPPKKPKPWGYYDWTRQIWVHKEQKTKTGKRVPMNRTEELEEERQAWGELWREERRGEWRGVRGGSQEPPRFQSCVAENMTQRMGWHGGDPTPHTMSQWMGWQGGTLGRVGDGHHHHMTKDLKNGFHNAGFGKRTAKPKPKKLSGRDVFCTNVLLFILDFVQDDTQVQLEFEAELNQVERRLIKIIVRQVITAGNIELLGTLGQYDLLLDIQRQNQYQISVVSEGDEVTRWLSIYKEEPIHVYLVTPHDFLPKEDDETAEQPSESSIYPASSDSDDDDNPFLKSIQKGLRKKTEKQCNIIEKTKRTESTPEEKMMEFFLEFVVLDCFTEMWFLGKFTEKQSHVINEFLNNLLTCIDDLDSFDGDKEMAKVFKRGDVQFELKAGSNGTTEIHKISANPPTEEKGTKPAPK